MDYSSSALTAMSSASISSTSYKRRRNEEDVEEGNPAKKAKRESNHSIPNNEAALAVLKNLSENWSSFGSTFPQHHEFIHKQVTQLTQVQQFFMDVLQNSQSSYQFDSIRLLLVDALKNKNFAAIAKHLSAMMQHHDFDRFLQAYFYSQQDFYLSLEAACQEPSKELFSTLMQEMHRLKPSFLTDPLFFSKMRKIFHKETCSDLKLMICSQQNDSQIVTVNINKAYLETVAPYFGTHSWVKTTQSERKFFLEKLQVYDDLPLTHENVYDVLRYCYTHTIYFRGAKECLAILLLAAEWQIKPLIEICDHYLAQSIDQLTDSFETVWEIAEGTQCTQLKNHLLHWAASQRLEGKPVDQKVLQILDKEKNQVKKWMLSFPLSKAQLKTIPTQFPQVERITFTGLEKKELEQHTLILKKWTSLTKLKLMGMDLSTKVLRAITSSELQSLTSLSLMNCTFDWIKLNPPDTNAAQLREFKLTKSFTETSFHFLEQCTNLESLTLHIDKHYYNGPFTGKFMQLEKLKTLRLLHLDIDDASLFPACQETLTKWTHLEQLELNSKVGRSADEAKIQSMIQKPNFPYLKIFKSNIAQHQISFLHTATQLNSVTQLSLITSIDPHQQSHVVSFSPMPSLNTLEWNCGGIININWHYSSIKHVPLLPFLASLENIQNLHLKNAQLDDATLTQLKQFSHLHTLHCEEITNLDDACLASLAELPWLESLTLTHCDLITDQGLRSLLNSENLQKVIIQDCVNISEQGAAALVKECQTIREFAFFSFREEYATFARAKKILDAKPLHTQAMAYLLKSMLTPGGATICEFANLAKAKLKEATERDPMQYMHWKNLGFVLRALHDKEGARQAYHHAARLGMDQAEYQEVLQQIQAEPGRTTISGGFIDQ